MTGCFICNKEPSFFDAFVYVICRKENLDFPPREMSDYDFVCHECKKKLDGLNKSQSDKMFKTIRKTEKQAENETQFWVCPHCGRDTEYKNGKQFCGSCKTYL